MFKGKDPLFIRFIFDKKKILSIIFNLYSSRPYLPSRTGPQTRGPPSGHHWQQATLSTSATSLCLEPANLPPATSSGPLKRRASTLPPPSLAPASPPSLPHHWRISCTPWSSAAACFSISQRLGPSAASPLSARQCLLPSSYHSSASTASRTSMLLPAVLNQSQIK